MKGKKDAEVVTLSVIKNNEMVAVDTLMGLIFLNVPATRTFALIGKVCEKHGLSEREQKRVWSRILDAAHEVADNPEYAELNELVRDILSHLDLNKTG